MSNSRKQRFLALASRQGHTRALQPLSSPPRLPCRSPGPGPSVPSPSCPEPRLSRVSKLTPAHNTPHEAISRLFYPQAAPATDSYFTHDQAQPHQSTALLRVAMDHHLTTQAASGSPLHSALFQPSRARPQQHAVCEIQQRPDRPVESAADAPPCSLMQVSTKMPTSLNVAAEERCWPPPLDGVSVARSKCSRAASPAAPLGR